MVKPIMIAVGANAAGPWGAPVETINHAMQHLTQSGVYVEMVSSIFKTSPLGTGLQSPYFNGVMSITTSLPAPSLLRLMKQIERESGRRGGRPWGPRTLDLDILDYKGLIVHWDQRRGRPGRCRRGELILPHAEMHKRAFVLVPLAEIAPKWLHPVFHKTASELMRHVGNDGQGRILEEMEIVS